MYVLQNLHWFVLLIGVLVFFHELGHFLFAKLFGVKVQRFSIGFGPRIVGFTRGETEYWLSAFPLGGYVKMLGEAPNTPIPEDEMHRAFLHKPVWQRAVIAVAGPVFNLILAFVVYVAMFVGTHTFGDTRVGIVTPGEPAWNAGLRPGDRIISIDGTSLDDWEDLRSMIADHPDKSMVVTYERNGTQVQATLIPVHATQPDVFDEPESRGKVGISLQYVQPIIGVVDHESPAARAGLRTGDRVVQVNGKPVTAWHELRAVLAAIRDPGASVSLVIESVAAAQTAKKTIELRPVPAFPAILPRGLPSSADTPSGYTGLVSANVVVGEVEAGTPAAKAGILVGDRLLRVATTAADGKTSTHAVNVWELDLGALNGLKSDTDIQLTVQRQLSVMPLPLRLIEREETDELKNRRKVVVFGAQPATDHHGLGTYTIDRTIGVGEAMGEAAKQVTDDATLIARALGRLVQGKLPMESMGGVIMLFVIAEKSAKRGAQVFLRTMAVISVNLGLLNLLPVPVLDGGHLMFCAIEAARRKPPSVRVREWANMVGLVLLLLLMLLAFRNDVLRYLF